MGEGPFYTETEGQIVDELPYNQNWWGVSALASFNLTEEVHAELGAGYKNRDGDDIDVTDSKKVNWSSNGADYDTYAIMAGFYYTPVDQLTIGVEGEWYTTSTEAEFVTKDKSQKIELDRDSDTYSLDLVSVWRF